MMYQATAVAELEEEVEAEGRKQEAGQELSPAQLAAIEQLIVEHRENGRKLSRSILRRWRVRMSPEEVDSIVDLTLCEAAHRYDASKGASFMTFFFYHLRGHLVRAVASAANASNIFLAYAQSNGLEVDDLSATSDEALRHFLPESAIFGKNEGEGPEQTFLRKEKISRCRDAISQLDELEQAVITRSFSGDEQLVNIAESLGYSRCHISRVKKRALERLKGIIEQLEPEEVRVQAVRTSRTAVQRKKTKRRARRRRISKESLSTPLMEKKRA